MLRNLPWWCSLLVVHVNIATYRVPYHSQSETNASLFKKMNALNGRQTLIPGPNYHVSGATAYQHCQALERFVGDLC